jgi:phosphoglycerol transferase MdoB-like AlkP superfamily enzyme
MTQLSLVWNNTWDRSVSWPRPLAFLWRLYLCSMLCFTFFRLLLLVQEFEAVQYLPAGTAPVLLLKAFLMGLRFDTVASGYLLVLPFLLLTGAALAGRGGLLIHRVALWVAIPPAFFAFFTCAANLPFFHHFYVQLNVSVFNSSGSGDSIFLWEMIFGEWRYYWGIAPMLLAAWFFIRTGVRQFRRHLSADANQTQSASVWPFLAFAILLFLGIWGRLPWQPPITGSAAFSSGYGLPDQLGLNPFYTFVNSVAESFNPKKTGAFFMDDEEAVRKVREYLRISGSEFDSPIARRVDYPDSAATRPNVVLVMMESMSAEKMGRYGNPNRLTPFMDSLATQAYTFDSVFTSGIHTFAGIYSNLFSMPVVKRHHPLMEMQPHSGFPQALKRHGYTTAYFTTHDEEFDHVGKFLRANGVDRIVSKAGYPPEKVLGALGVPDDYLYEHAIGIFNELHQSGKPFFGAIMTGSDHGPYVIPEYFKPKHEDKVLGIVEYVDWSVRKFLQEAAKEPWFGNTIFIFVADHGASVVKRYDLPLSYLHTPLIMYAPKILGPPRTLASLGSQLDIFPTIMGLLQLDYVNNTLGVDLFRESRPFAISYADDKYAVLDSEYIYVSRENGVSSLYRFRTNDLKDYLDEKPDLATAMKTYGESMFQTTQWLRERGLTREQSSGNNEPSQDVSN